MFKRKPVYPLLTSVSGPTSEPRALATCRNIVHHYPYINYYCPFPQLKRTLLFVRMLNSCFSFVRVCSLSLQNAVHAVKYLLPLNCPYLTHVLIQTPLPSSSQCIWTDIGTTGFSRMQKHCLPLFIITTAIFPVQKLCSVYVCWKYVSLCSW